MRMERASVRNCGTIVTGFHIMVVAADAPTQQARAEWLTAPALREAPLQ
jgi:hypothetical protein